MTLILTAIDKDTRQTRNVLSTSDGALCVELTPRYSDLGEVIGGDSGAAGYQLAAGASVYSSYFSSIEWQRYIIAIYKTTSGASATLYLCRVDSSGVEANAYQISTMGGTGTYWNGTPLSSSNAVLQPIGCKGRFRVTNTGSSAIDVWLHVQLLG